MSRFDVLSKKLLKSMEVPGLKLPVAGIKLFFSWDTIPEDILQYQPDGMTVTSCHAIKAAMLEDAVYLTKDSIGCVAAAISLGLVSEDQSNPLEGKRVYTEIMREKSGKGSRFVPPSPLDFTAGTVYACKDTGKLEFGLFGEKDSGRYKTKKIAQDIILNMPSIQPPNTRGAFYFSPDFIDEKITPDIVILSLRPVELCRVVQGYQFLTGKRLQADIGGVRAGCADLIAQPYLKQKINFSPYCLGARLIAGFEADRMGIGMPFSDFELMVKGVSQSRTGFPFSRYPGAVP